LTKNFYYAKNIGKIILKSGCCILGKNENLVSGGENSAIISISTQKYNRR
jgi:hypothetical protein